MTDFAPSSDDAIRQDIIIQTAELRWSVRSNGLRRLLQEKGYAPDKCIQTACDQGDDVNLEVVLNDGTVVNLDYREDRLTRQATGFTGWEVRTGRLNSETEMALRILHTRDKRFDEDVLAYYMKNMAELDRPLPPK